MKKYQDYSVFYFTCILYWPCCPSWSTFLSSRSQIVLCDNKLTLETLYLLRQRWTRS